MLIEIVYSRFDWFDLREERLRGEVDCRSSPRSCQTLRTRFTISLRSSDCHKTMKSFSESIQRARPSAKLSHAPERPRHTKTSRYRSPKTKLRVFMHDHNWLFSYVSWLFLILKRLFLLFATSRFLSFYIPAWLTSPERINCKKLIQLENRQKWLQSAIGGRCLQATVLLIRKKSRNYSRSWKFSQRKLMKVDWRQKENVNDSISFLFSLDIGNLFPPSSTPDFILSSFSSSNHALGTESENR